jgi:hypothetical protein
MKTVATLFVSAFFLSLSSFDGLRMRERVWPTSLDNPSPPPEPVEG